MFLETVKKYFENIEKLKQKEREFHIIERDIADLERKLKTNTEAIKQLVDEHSERLVYICGDKVITIEYGINNTTKILIKEARIIK